MATADTLQRRTRTRIPDGGRSGSTAGMRSSPSPMTTLSGITSTTVERMIESEADFVGRIVGAVGDSERVMVLGPASLRLAVQRALRGGLAPPGPPRGGGRRTGPIDAIGEQLAERLRALGT